MVKHGATSRGLRALIAASCLVWSSCALEPLEQDEEVEPAADQTVEADELAGADQPADETMPEGEPEDAVCVAYGRRCSDTSDCCPDLTCAFDGYVRYCRY